MSHHGSLKASHGEWVTRRQALLRQSQGGGGYLLQRCFPAGPFPEGWLYDGHGPLGSGVLSRHCAASGDDLHDRIDVGQAKLCVLVCTAVTVSVWKSMSELVPVGGCR